MSAPKRVPGFCLRGTCLDGKTTLYINVCGDDAVGLPLTKNMEPIPSPSFIDQHGVDNLIVPIAVDEPVPFAKGSTDSFVVDAVIHSSITERVRPSHHLYEHMLTRITSLALQWVTQEQGFKLVPRSVHVFPGAAYVDGVRPAADPSLEALLKATKGLVDAARGEMDAKAAEASAAADGDNPVNPLFVVNSKEEPKEAPRKGPLIQEMTPESEAPQRGLKRGFLSQTNGSLYGEKGSTEGAAPPLSDPLAFVPEGLRGKCKVVDMREGQPAAPQRAKAAADTPSASSSSTGITIKEVGAGPKPLWSHTTERADGHLVVTITPPAFIKSVADLEDLSIEADGISINYGQYLVRITEGIDSDEASARFVKKTGQLVIKCPLL